MDQQGGTGGSLFGAYGSVSPGLGSPGWGGNPMPEQQELLILSPNPYLNFDPHAIRPTPESQFIFPEGANQRRGRFELAFQTIGASVFAGATAGGVNGLYSGIKETSASQLTGPIRRTQMLNFIAKQGASSAQTLGIVALMYSGFGVVISKLRGVDDELNTMVAGTATGFLFKSSAGWKKCLRAGGIGFGLATFYCLLTSRDRIKQMIGWRDS